MTRRVRHGASCPRFTVIMPAHNSTTTIDGSIASVLAQTVEDFELLVIENGSSDDTLERARRWSARDPRVYATTLDAANLVAARNAGIREARGRFVAFLDADDVYAPGFLATLETAIAAHPGRSMYALGGVSVAPDGKRSPLSPSMAADRPTELTLAIVVWMTLFPNQVAYDADALRALGGFRDHYIEDYDLWVHTFATGGTGVYVPAEASEHRVYWSSRSHDPAFYDASVGSALESLRDALTEDLAPVDREAVERRIALLEKRRARIGERAALEERLSRGEYAGARRSYLRAGPAYRSRLRYLGGLALILVSPRLFARAARRRDEGA